VGKYEHEFEGVNSRLDGLHAAVLAVKLQHLGEWVERRRQHAATYNQLLAGIDQVLCPELGEEGEHAFHLYVVRVERRDRLREFLAQRGVATGVHYPHVLASLPAYEYLGHGQGDFPVAASLQHQILSLPMYPELTPAQIEYVVEGVREFYRG
jgi:dTDP-4-amino-4,6-dideoxygalactose transaminase